MTASTRQQLAQQVIAQAEQFDAIYESDDPYEELYEAPLEITVGRELTVLLCTGGPHVEATASVNDEGAVITAQIHGYWGSERVSRSVRPGSSLWRALGDYAQCVVVPS